MNEIIYEKQNRSTKIDSLLDRAELRVSPWQKLIYALALAVVMVMYASIYFGNTFPVSEGWNVNYAELVLRGKLPYRDFYYYLPPLNILIDIVLWSLSFGSLFVYRVWWFLQRIAIFEMIFFLLCRYFKPAPAFLACAFGSILVTASSYDLFGDYNQTMIFLSVILIICAIRFAEAQALKKKCGWLLLSGIVISLLFLVKQTIFLAAVLTYLVVLGILCAKRRDKNWWKYIAAVAIGVVTILLPTLIFMLCTGMLVPFVEQVFLYAGGKGDMYHVIFENFINKFFMIGPWILTALIMVTAYFGAAGRQEKYGKLVGGSLALFCGAIAFFCYDPLKQALAAAGTSWRFQSVILLGAIPAVAVLVMWVTGKGPAKLRSSKAALAAVVLWAAVVLIGGYLTDDLELRTLLEKAEEEQDTELALGSYVMKYLYTGTGTMGAVNDILYFFALYSLLVLLVSRLFRKEQEGEAGSSIIWLLCGAFSCIYAGAMASPKELVYYSTMIAIPVVLCFGFSMVLEKKKVMETALRGGLIVLCTVLCLFCVSQKYVNSYSWWGSGEAKAKVEKTYSTNIKALKGFTFAEDVKEKYEGVTRVISENSNRGDVVYAFPHAKLFNVLTDRYEQETFVPVMFYDVVDDRYVEKENELLKTHLPDILVIQDIPGCMDIHESYFRDEEPLVQRKTLEYFEEVIPEKYESLGTFDDITVYKLK